MMDTNTCAHDHDTNKAKASSSNRDTSMVLSSRMNDSSNMNNQHEPLPLTPTPTSARAPIAAKGGIRHNLQAACLSTKTYNQIQNHTVTAVTAHHHHHDTTTTSFIPTSTLLSTANNPSSSSSSSSCCSHSLIEGAIVNDMIFKTEDDSSSSKTYMSDMTTGTLMTSISPTLHHPHHQTSPTVSIPMDTYKSVSSQPLASDSLIHMSSHQPLVSAASSSLPSSLLDAAAAATANRMTAHSTFIPRNVHRTQPTQEDTITSTTSSSSSTKIMNSSFIRQLYELKHPSSTIQNPMIVRSNSSSIHSSSSVILPHSFHTSSSTTTRTTPSPPLTTSSSFINGLVATEFAEEKGGGESILPSRTNLSTTSSSSSSPTMDNSTSQITNTSTTTTNNINNDNNDDNNNPSPLSSLSLSVIEKGGGIQDRKQKRLERNRVSARESRRRRKQYLEVLEDRVTTFSDEMDRGRREHVLHALSTNENQREAFLLYHYNNYNNNEGQQEQVVGVKEDEHQSQVPIRDEKNHPNHSTVIPIMDAISSSSFISSSHITTMTTKSALYSFTQDFQECLKHMSRSSRELRLANAFCKEYLTTLVLPTTFKFIMWLTLQNDEYFRGGRAPSERLSAARIGERMLNFENDRVGPSQGMWPLFCHEINLSFDQEERVRNYQRQLLSNPESWMERHVGTAAMQMIQSLHNAILGLMEASHHRERKFFQCLSQEQQVKFLHWSLKKRAALGRIFQRELSNKSSSINPTFQTRCKPQIYDSYKLGQSRHDAVNLYILNHKFSEISKAFPKNEILFDSSISFKKLGRRPTFESLGNSTATDDICGGESNMTTCSSSSSLKRCSSEMSCDDLESVKTSSDGMGFKRSTSSQRFLMDDIPVPVTSSSSSAMFIHTTPESAQVLASVTLASILDPIRAIIPSLKDYDIAALPNFTLAPTLLVERLPQVSVNLRGIKSTSSTHLLNQGISAIEENDANHKRPQGKQISQPAPSFQSSQSAPIICGLHQSYHNRPMNSTESRAKTQAAISQNIMTKPVNINKTMVATPLLQGIEIEKDIKSLHDAFTNSLTGGSFFHDDILSGNSLEDIALDLSSKELKQVDPLQCMVYDDLVSPIMSTLDDDLLLALASDDDWAIGEGLDMDMS